MTIPLKTNLTEPLAQPEVTARELKELLEKNLALTEEVHQMTHKIKRYITFQKVLSLIYFLLIVVPLVLGAIYLPPLLKGIASQYSDFMGVPGAKFDLESFLQGRMAPPAQQ